MTFSDYFFKTTFSPIENFHALREDPNKDSLGFKSFALSIGIQIAIKLVFIMIMMGRVNLFLTSFLTSAILSVLAFNLLILIVAHYGINQAANGKHADWQLIMALLGMSSLPLIISIVLSSAMPMGGQIFSFLGSVGTGVILGLGAHVTMGLQKESAIIVTPILIVLMSYLANFVFSFFYLF